MPPHHACYMSSSCGPIAALVTPYPLANPRKGVSLASYSSDRTEFMLQHLSFLSTLFFPSCLSFFALPLCPSGCHTLRPPQGECSDWAGRWQMTVDCPVHRVPEQSQIRVCWTPWGRRARGVDNSFISYQCESEANHSWLTSDWVERLLWIITTGYEACSWFNQLQKKKCMEYSCKLQRQIFSLTDSSPEHRASRRMASGFVVSHVTVRVRVS